MKNKLLIIVGGILLVGTATVGILQKDNIKAVVVAKTTSTEELVVQIEDNKKEIEEAIRSYNLEPIKDLTFEEEEQIRKGKITPKVALEKVVEKDSKAEAVSMEGLVQDASTKMYTLKAEYLGLLGAVEATAKGDYLAVPKKERGLALKQKIVSKHMGYVIGLEGTCDAKVGEVLATLEADLEERGFDIGIVGTMRRAYQSEKTLKKAYYMSLLVN